MAARFIFFISFFTTHFAMASDLAVKAYSTYTNVQISGAPAKVIYDNLQIQENTTGSDEDGAPMARKMSDSINCVKGSESVSDFVCIMYVDHQTGKVTSD